MVVIPQRLPMPVALHGMEPSLNQINQCINPPLSILFQDNFQNLSYNDASKHGIICQYLID